MNITDNVRRAFRSKYSFDIQATWLQACLLWLRDQFQLPDLTNNYALEKVFNQWLHTDISLIADAHCLPNDLDLNAKKVQLTGKYALQINQILCISEAYYTQVQDIHGDQNDNEGIDTDITETQQWKPPPPKRVLYLELTDGKTLLRGLEYETIQNLDRDTTLPGAKILVTGPVLFRRGMLLLTSKNTQVLGGYVEDLLQKNSSMETALAALSKTSSKLDESRRRFDRLNFKVHQEILSDQSIPDPQPPQQAVRISPLPISQENEDEMDEFIRQAYADGMLNDDSHLAPQPTDHRSSLSSYNTIQPSTVTRNSLTEQREEEEVIFVTDEDDIHTRFSEQDIVPLFSPMPNDIFSSLSPPRPATPPSRPPMKKISLSFTYLSLIRSPTFSSHTTHEDFQIKACFSSLVSNPRLINNQYDLQAYVNDGSDCLLVRLASDLLTQRIGITVDELMRQRKACQNDSDKQKFQSDFNDRLKKFGHGLQRLYSTMTIRFFSDNQIPMIIQIDDD